MSLKSLLMPAISEHLLGRARQEKQRRRAEQVRLLSRQRHVVHYFHQVDDPYSALAAASLQDLIARYDIDLLGHVVNPPIDAAAPERDKLVAYSRKDAALLARRFGLTFHDQGAQPAAHSLDRATQLLVSAARQGRFAEAANLVSGALWQDLPRFPSIDFPDGPIHPADPAAVTAHLATADRLRQRLGHYLGATFFYAGEWYWGIDRLHHLERRLQSLGATRQPAMEVLFAPAVDLALPLAQKAQAPIDFYFSLRSPYSAIVAPRVFELARLTGAEVRLRFVLPMVMRGLPVPRNKRSYIALDCAREARARNIPFGRVNDPVGRPTERGLALIPLAERQGLGQAYLLSFMQGVWAEGIHAGSDRGLRNIAERAGLSWDEARHALHDQAWRETAEQNRAEMFSLGLWGVPSFRVGQTVAWGQDRLWLIEAALTGAPQ